MAINSRALKILRATHEPTLTQYAAGKAIGMGWNRWHRIENGQIEPTKEERQKIAELFGVKVRAFWTDESAAVA